jgi:hypothetical protein
MSETIRHKRGDVGPDGLVFWSYHRTCKDGQNWKTPESFAAIKAKRREYQTKPESIAKRREYHTKHEYKAKRREYQTKPEYKAKRREYHTKPESIAKRREYDAKPEYKAKRRKRNASYYAATRKQSAADQFFLMAGAAESLKELATK